MVGRLQRLAAGLWSPEPSPPALVLGLCLRPLGWVYGLGMRFRAEAFARGWLKMGLGRLPVISVGNLTLGGTGKTPLVRSLALTLVKSGFKPAVLLRGYGGSAGRGPVLVRPGMGPEEVGDEALLLAAEEGLTVIVGQDRTAGTGLAQKLGCRVVLLDDGFQHLSLGRNLDLVLLDAAAPLGNGLVFPAGPLREPPKALSRAGAFVLTRAEDGAAVERARTLLGRLGPGRPVFTARHRITGVEDGRTGRPVELEGKKVLTVAGVARPDQVAGSLTALGPAQVELIPLADHQIYTEAQVELINRRAQAAGSELIVTTQKDRPKLEPFLDLLVRPLAVTRLEMEIDDRPRLGALVREAAAGRGAIPGLLKKARRGLPSQGRMLIRMPNWLGDTVMATPVLDNLLAALPGWELSLLLPASQMELFQADPRVKELIPVQAPGPHQGFKGRRTLARELRGRFQAGLLLTNSLNTALVLALARMPRRIGYARDGRSLLLTDPVPFTTPLHLGSQVEGYLGLLAHLRLQTDSRQVRLFLPDSLREQAREGLAGEGGRTRERLIGLAPGAAFGPAKAWPAERFGLAGGELAGEGPARILILGSDKESEAARLAAGAVSPRARVEVVDLTGRTSLGQAAALIGELDLLLTNDSGLMHLAAALNRPFVALYGPTDPLNCLHSHGSGTFLWHPDECAPCRKRDCPKGRSCIENITVEEVVEAGFKLLEETG